MYILGLNAYHGDASACLLRDGELIAAVEEERFTRIKHWAGFPRKAVEYCLAEAGVRLTDLDHVAVNTNPSANILRKLSYTIRHRPGIHLVLDRINNRQRRVGIGGELEALFPTESLRAKVHFVEHHKAHLASAHLVSPFEESVVVSIDGFGDFSSSAWGVGRGSDIEVEGRVHFPHSLGVFYQALTQYLGFANYGDEYKVMGLASYGQPRFLDEMRSIVVLSPDGGYRLNLTFFRHHKEKIEYTWRGGAPRVGKLFSPELTRLLGMPERHRDDPVQESHRDLACSVQAMYEEALFNLLRVLYARHGMDRLSLAGGCAMNSVANGKIHLRTPFQSIYVPPAAGDAGGAIGCAYALASEVGLTFERFHMSHAYWGPAFNNDCYQTLLSSRKAELDAEDCAVEHMADEEVLYTRTADAISQGKVVGWFQGRMEWGPRALGGRSILCDPRRDDMKDILNLKIKRRESFRPFAPAILRDKVGDWFEEDLEVPFMSRVLKVRGDKRHLIPAVTHVDGTGRLQTVGVEVNPRYYNLIEKFGNKTDVPLLLNTSFNENEPIVCLPEEAVDCFLRTRMDVLVLGDFFVYRRTEDSASWR